MAQQQDDTFVTRAERQKCWDARDGFFACLTENKIRSLRKPEARTAVSEKCKEASDVLHQSCRQAWVDHFMRLRERELGMVEFKKRIADNTDTVERAPDANFTKVSRS
ncbi:hypothetical protein BZA70DRAFT_273372 [Myxozyma melibiosi]|uniref:Cytochrome c oxidase assembly factor 6 n=1 Tax=Myxozyma melibiosi TaxID=54550 RepID=A0ABR1FEK9_9ASCO